MAYIYKITEISSGRFYVGKTEKFDIQTRFEQHIKASRKQKCETHLHRSIKIYGESNYRVELLEEINDISELNSKEIYYINLMKPELNMTKGGEGGSTTHNRIWINDGTVDKYWLKDILIPDGWVRGRLNTKFRDSDFQKEMSKRSDRKKAGESTKKKWAAGEVIRDHSKCGSKGEDNPAKRPEVAKKISDGLTKYWEQKKKDNDKI